MLICRRFFIVFIAIGIILSPFRLKAEEDFYYIYNLKEKIEEFTSYEDALEYFEDNIDEYQNLVLMHNDEVIDMEYGIVKFNTDKACSITAPYYSINRDAKDYINGCYGIDAAYLKSDHLDNTVYFKISGDIGYTDRSNVSLIPFENLDVRVSLYNNTSQHLIHNIKNQLDSDYFAYSLQLDRSLDILKADKEYYSYDGHYFYDDFYRMIDDYRNETYDNACNEEPYYNYFQYLPYRSLSSYSLKQIEDYFYNSLGINGRLLHYYDYDNDNAADEINRSQLFEQIDRFFIYQYMYGCNAMMLLSSAINESAYGRSLNSFTNNNLYLAAAYETAQEKDVSRYDSIDSSIYSYAKYYVSSLFSNHLRSDYAGTNYGNKNCGVNVNYSIDPYYGEKNSATYYSLDNIQNLDYNQYALGVIIDEDRLTFYDDENLDKKKFVLKDINELVLIILNEYEDSYKVQIDSSLSDENLYDFEKSVAYIRKDAFRTILNKDRIHENKYHIVHYDFNGGSFHDYQSLDIKYPDGNEELVIKPVKDGYEFKEYENNVAQYQKINEILLTSSGNDTFELNGFIDLQNYKVKIDYDNNESRTIEVNTDMFRGYNNTISGKQNIDITYNGLSIPKEIEFNEELFLIRNNITDSIKNEDYVYVKENIDRIRYPLTFNQIRNIDFNLKQLNNRNYVISDNTEKYNISISGLDLSLADKQSFNLLTSDTYYVLVDNISSEAENKIFNLASGYGFDKVEGIDIDFRFNYQDIDLTSPVIVQIALENKRNDLVYSVYHLSKDGDIVKCRTTQSDNYVQFLIQEDGSYLVLSRESVNEYDIDDQTEDLSYENMGFDNHRINIHLMTMLALVLFGIIGILSYYVINDKRKRIWKDFKKSLRIAGYVQEEKPKN